MLVLAFVGCSGDRATATPAPGAASANDCGDGPACDALQTCVRYFPVANAPAAATFACVETCSYAGDDCGEGRYCAMDSAGPGFSCADAVVEPPEPWVAHTIAIAKVWSFVRFAHPWLARGRGDWTTPLVAAVKAVRADPTQTTMVAAVDTMLAALGDPSTHVVPAEKVPTWVQRTEGPPLRTEDDGTVVMTMSALDAWNTEQSDAIAAAFVEAKRIVIDMRGTPSPTMPLVELVFERLHHALAAEPMEVAERQVRVMHGFPTEVGLTSGGYYEAFEAGAVPVVVPKRERPAGSHSWWTTSRCCRRSRCPWSRPGKRSSSGPRRWTSGRRPCPLATTGSLR